ncbi:unnamed protein product [Mytilus edulis]|uniref:Novel STAND NTPase 3 domain-containing protein n=1 Tax=Mytilus edulis TaxID=6550 RepID=A0A8S3R1J7_MYTED|nr:unnamed protein product [Mytilus edulis]
MITKLESAYTFLIMRYMFIIVEDFKEKKKILEENTEKRIKKHDLDETFYVTTAVKEGTRLLDSNNILVLLGTEKCGKTEACLSLCKRCKEKDFAIIYLTSSNKEEVKYFIDKDKKEIYVFDINMKPTEDDALKELIDEVKLHASENIRFIFTVKTSAVTKLFDNLPADQQVKIDSLNEEDKKGILMNHMKHNNIDVCKVT